MSMNVWRLGLVVPAVLAWTCLARAEIFYQTGFEGPAWTVGPLGGPLPDGWGSFGPWAVVTNQFAGGTQALGITHNPTDFPLSGAVLDMYIPNSPGAIIMMSADMRLDGPQVPSRDDGRLPT